MKISDGTKELIFNNPLVHRYCYSLLRPSQFWIYLTIYISVIILLLFINYSFHQIASDSVIDEEFYSKLYYQILGLEVVILWIWATINSGSAIKNEVSDKTYDFFRLLPLSALQKATGILVGKNFVALLLAGINLGFILLFGLLGKISGYFQVQVIVLLVSAALFANSIALLSSNISPKRQRKTSIFVWILILIFLGPFFLRILFLPLHITPEIEKAERYLVGFYTIELPILLLISFICVYFGFWNILGIIRKFTFETEPLFSRKAALLFLLGFEIIATGLFLPHISENEMVVYLFWLVSLSPAVFIPVGSLKSFDSYLECCGLLRSSSGSDKSMTSTLLVHSNLTLALGLFGIWAIFSVPMSVISRVDPSQFIFDMVVIFSFYLFLILLLELHAVYSRTYNKIGLLLGFVGILYLLLPIILSFSLEKPTLVAYSLFGFFAHIFHPLETKGFEIHTSVCIVNTLLCIVPVWLISKGYFHILAVRRKMRLGCE
ncbi:MAG: hypothetical protein ACETVZ_07675 [Phycisphaerae bacterium]